MNQEFSIRKLSGRENIPFELLLLADPSTSMIETYIYNSEIFVVETGGAIIACCALCRAGEGIIEIKNIAVKDEWQGKGIGSMLLGSVIENCKNRDIAELIIGTGNSSIGQLYLYQKAGFRITGIKKDYFSDNYPEIIVENGIVCSDMIILSLTL